jgi:outer membrane receptor protein involved in Fe transport
MPLTAAIYLAFSAAALAQDASPAAAEPERTATLETVTVTAQKRSENLQKVPISIQVLGAERLDELNITDFDDYVKFLPSVSYQSFGPGFSQVYMRGVASGGDGNHSGPLPSVGMYLDEQPITTIQGALDVHLYDIERVEALAGPQGTLYGASSQSGTIRIISNKPDPSGFAAGYAFEANTMAADGGGSGYVAEAFVNAPIAESAAIRLVGWQKEDAGYIDNVYGTRTFPSSGITVDNADRVEDNYNDAETTGARVALRVELGDNWTVTPTLMAQNQTVNGSFGYDNNVGNLELSHRFPEFSEDRWHQAALTVEGKIGNFDLTYAYSQLNRDVDTESDYSDYAYWYDVLYGYGAYICDSFDTSAFACAAGGSLIDPSQYIQGVDGYTKRSHELRIASPQENRFRFVTGLFWQQQNHDIQQRYLIKDLSPEQSITGWEDTLWLTKQVRRDHDEAVFGEVSFDVTDKLTVTGGARYFRAENSLEGFFGFADWGWSSTGEAKCAAGSATFHGAPCNYLGKTTEESDWLGRFNVTYQIDDNKLIYGTWSQGYRPGGINRRGTLPPYVSDYLSNYEFGWKSTWADNRLMFNGAVFQENWEDFQFALLGQNGLTEIKNANQAQIRGLELDMSWAATYNFRVSGGMGWYDAQLTENYCGFTDANGNPVTDCPDPEAPDGTRLPVTAEFKGNLTGRYIFDVGDYEAYLQGSVVYEGDRTSDLRVLEQGILGDLPAYWLTDFSAGFKKNSWAVDVYLKNALDENPDLYRYAQCAETVCGGQLYTVTTQPRTLGVRFSQKF